MPKVKFKISTSRINKRLEKLGQLKHVVERAVKLRAQAAVEQIRDKIDNDSTSITSIARRSGDLHRHIQYKIEKEGSHLTATIGVLNASVTTVKKALLQENGGLQRAKHARLLAYPPEDVGPPIRGSRGEQLLTVEEAQNHYRMWYTPDAILGVEKGTTGGRPKVLFIRKESVVIPARPFIGPQRERLKKFMKEDLYTIITDEMIHLGLR